MPVRCQVEDELDGILAEDCPFCGQLMIDTIMKPFIDPNEAGEAEEIESWAIWVDWSWKARKMAVYDMRLRTSVSRCF